MSSANDPARNGVDRAPMSCPIHMMIINGMMIVSTASDYAVLVTSLDSN